MRMELSPRLNVVALAEEQRAARRIVLDIDMRDGRRQRSANAENLLGLISLSPAHTRSSARC